MKQVSLTIWSEGSSSNIDVNQPRLTIGRGDSAGLRLADQGLSRIHASVNRDGDRVWVLDEGSTNGTFVNGSKIDASGKQLRDGDQITIGNTTKISVAFSAVGQRPINQTTPAQTPVTAKPSGSTSPAAYVIAACAVIAVVGVVALVGWQMKRKPTTRPGSPPVAAAVRESVVSPSSTGVDENVKIDETSESSIAPTALTSLRASQLKPVTVGNTRLYQKMTEEEQVYFVYTKAKEIALLVGNRPAEFPDEAITIIKFWLDAYVRRIGNGSSRLWAEDLNSMFKRARTSYVPTIIRAFKANNAPPAVGVYLPVIETEYRNIPTENFAGAAGLFQFIGPTARGYGVDPSERTNIEKMAPAAARYINNRLAEFGPDAVGVGLSIAGYNRSPDSVRRDLHDVIDSKNKDRDFWILVKNKSRLDQWFQKENINYVPRFFAAAIIGENPWNFGMKMRQLTSYTEPAQED